MPTLSAGKHRNSEGGVTLIEMLVVVSLIAILAGITFPAVTSGIETLRVSAASESIVSFFNAALTRAQRRQDIVQVVILPDQRALEMRSSEAGFHRRIELPKGVAILAPEEARQYILYPDGSVPKISVHIAGDRGDQRLVSIDPITGVSRVTLVEGDE